jgi:hypothetical protein
LIEKLTLQIPTLEESADGKGLRSRHADEATLNEQRTVPVRTDETGEDAMPQIFLNSGDNNDLKSELDAMDPLLEVRLDCKEPIHTFTQRRCEYTREGRTLTSPALRRRWRAYHGSKTTTRETRSSEWG